METQTPNPENPDSSQSNSVKETGSSAVVRRMPWSRRRVITLITSVAAGLLTVRFWPKEEVETPKTLEGKPHNPRFKRVKTPALSAKVSVSKGFYVRLNNQYVPPNPKQQVQARAALAAIPARTIIHYVDETQRALFLERLNDKRLRVAQTDELSLKSPNVRVRLSRASAIFEIAALEHVKNDQYLEACRLLVNGINHDFSFKGRQGVSLRLFDLLAKIAVRRQDEQYLNELLTLAEKASGSAQQTVRPGAERKPSPNNSPAGPDANKLKQRKTPKEIFDIRFSKWKDPDSEWRKRVLEAKEVYWKITWAPDTTNAKPETRTFEIKKRSQPVATNPE